MAEIDQGIEVLVGADPHAAAITAVATVRPAQRNELLATETDAAVAAIAGDHLDFCFVYKFHDSGCQSGGGGREVHPTAESNGPGTIQGRRREMSRPIVDTNEKPRRSGAFVSDPTPWRGRLRTAEDQASATTLTVRRFFGPLTENSTLPSTSANRVWSRPRPTPVPGWNWVPR
ncbi:hypothetical protein D3C71_1662740 [compost metagenome]